ncbi:hypothetical protein J1N35_028824 [Gossypium stocksii]|uniref:Reverse transcriptase Ty1/copia-type domain-containing protein n=1 Tax=Gossypium stocksii TaxID=47602 RepID=A0A9D3UX20_9ROSI|nr:hypothetical protein J1N35_028824 [Gossypium stocksii]
MKADGTIDKYKARLIIKEIHQMDVKTAFLNGDLDEEIYMEQLESHVASRQERKVYKSVKSLYGLKQAPKQWHEKFDMNDMGLVDVILGIQIKRSSEGLVLTQSHNVDKNLKKFGKEDFGVARTPIDISQHLSPKKGKVLTKWNMQES